MGAESFFRRWARLKSEDSASPVPAPEQSKKTEAYERPLDRHGGAAASATQLPTIEDVARLTPDSDYSAFVAKGVDKSVQRLAMKKLFSDPHFNIMDGLDIYIDDYNKAAPIPAVMLASLRQAQSFLDPEVVRTDPVPDAPVDELQESRDQQAKGAAGSKEGTSEGAE